MGEWTAKVLLTDGTTQIVEIDEDECDDILLYPATEATENTEATEAVYGIGWKDPTYTKAGSNVDGLIFKYSVNDKGEYDLDPIAVERNADGVNGKDDRDEQAANFGDIKNGKAYISIDDTLSMPEIIVDRKTVFVDDEGETAYIGYKEVPNMDNAEIHYVVNDNIVVVAFVLDGEIYDTDATYFILADNDRESLKYDSKYYWEYEDAYVNGEKQTLTIAYNCIKSNESDKDVLEVNTLYKVKKTIDEDYITEIEVVTKSDNAGKPNAVGEEAFWLTTAEDKVYKYDTDENTVYVTVEKDIDDGEWEYSISEGNLSDLKDDDIINVWVVEADDEYAELVYIWITDGAEDAADLAKASQLGDIMVAGGLSLNVEKLEVKEGSLEAGALSFVLYDKDGNVLAEAIKVTETKSGAVSCTMYTGEHDSSNWDGNELVDLTNAYSWSVCIYDVEIASDKL